MDVGGCGESLAIPRAVAQKVGDSKRRYHADRSRYLESVDERDYAGVRCHGELTCLLWFTREAGVRAAPLRQPIHFAAVFNGSLTLSEVANSTFWSLPAIFSIVMST